MASGTNRYSVEIDVSLNTAKVKSSASQIPASVEAAARKAVLEVKKIEAAYNSLPPAVQRAVSQTTKVQDDGARHAQRLAEMTARAQIKAAEQVARDTGKAKESERRLFEKAEQHKQKLAQDSARAQARSAEQAIQLEESARAREFREYQRIQREKTKIAEREARAQTRAAQSGLSLQQTGRGIRNAGLAATAGITAPLVLGARAVLQAGTEYEQALNVFQATTRATTEEMERARAVAKALGADLSLPATSAADAALAMTELAKGGFSAAQAMQAAKGVLQLAAAAQVSEAEAAEMAANAINAFNLQASDSTKIADLFAAAANASSAEIGQISEAMQQASAVFASAKVPVEDLTALIGQMANAGIKGSDAGTSLKTMLIALTAPTDKSAKLMGSLGLSVFDAQGKMKPFRDLIEQFSGTLGKMNQEQQSAALKTIFGTDAMRAATIIFGKGVETFDQMRAAVTRQGAAAELAAAKTRGLGGAWEALKSQLETIAIGIYEKVSQPLETAARVAGEFAAKAGAAFEKLPAGVQTAAIAFAAVLALVGPLAIGLGAVVAAVGLLGAKFIAVAAIITGAVAAAAAVYSTNFLGIRDLTNEALSEIVRFVEEQGGKIVGWWRENLPLIQQTVQTVLTNVRAFWAENGEQIMEVVRSAWAVVKAVVGTTLDFILGAIKLTMQIINNDWAGAWDTFKKFLSTALDGAIQLWARFQSALGGLILGLAKFVYEKSQEVGQNIVTGIAAGIQQKFPVLSAVANQLVIGPLALIKSGLQMKSPSLVYKEVGLNIALGLALGIAAGQPAVAEALGRLVIPDKVELATGKGSRAINTARRKADSANRPGYDLLQKLYDESDRHIAKTRLQQVEIELLDKKYKNLAGSIRAAIIAEAERLDNVSIQERFKSILEQQNTELRGQETNVQEINRLLSDPKVLTALGARTALMLRMNAFALDWKDAKIGPSEAGPALPAGLEKTLEEVRKVTAKAIPFINTHDDPPPVESTQAAKALEAFRDYMERTVQDIGRIFGDAVYNWDGTFGGFFKSIASGFGNLFRRVVADFVESGISNLFRNLFSSLTGGVSGQGGGGFLGSIFKAVTGGGLRGTPGFNPSGGLSSSGGLGSVLGSFLNPVNAPISASQRPPGGLFGGGGLSGLSSLFGGGKGGFSLSGLGASLGPMLPLLGLGLGAGLGRGSLGGSILGSLGMGALGLFGAGALGVGGTIGGIFGGVSGTLGAGLGAVGLGGLASFALPGLGVALLAGALLLGRNAQRRRDERTRDALSNDTGTAIWQLIKLAQQGRLGVSEAKTQFDQVMARYDQGVAQIKDSKTRRIAELTRSHFTALWPVLEANAREHTDAARERAKSFRETFSTPAGFDYPNILSGASGGSSAPSIASALQASRSVSALSMPSFTPPSVPSFSAPSFSAPNFSGGAAFAPSAGGETITLQIGSIEVLMTDEAAGTVTLKGLKSSDGRRVVAEIAESRVKIGALRRP